MQITRDERIDKLEEIIPRLKAKPKKIRADLEEDTNKFLSELDKTLKEGKYDSN